MLQNEYYISKPSAFMHLCPDGKSEVTDELLYGTEISVFDESYAGYVYCKTDYGYGGYVDVSSLSPCRKNGAKTTVTSSFCDFYEYPEYRFAPVMTLCRGCTLRGETEAVGDGGFVGVETEKGRLFAPSKCLEIKGTLPRSDEKSLRKKIVECALSYLGTSYRWGGKSTYGIDCSGLCFMAYTLCGLSLYRDAEPDGRYVKKICFSELVPADLIYYNGHVTMYIGEGKYVHSSATLGGVCVGSLDAKSPMFYPKLSSGIVCCARNLAFPR